MRSLPRDWPPDTEPKTTKSVNPEAHFALALFLLSPLGTWIVFALPGPPRWWAGLVWPIGWSISIILALVGATVRRPK